jgi:tetratricopeptide (TPR) repeat protein
MRADLWRRSPRLCELLAFLAKASADGEQLKESLIGVQLFGRDPGYDPKVDPVVRTEVRRLRLKLAEYYATEGQNNPVCIEIPKGAYVLQLRPRVPAVSAEPVRKPRSRRWLTAAGTALACLLAIGAVWWVRKPHAPAAAKQQRYAARTPAVQELYLRGRELLRTRQEPKIREAIRLFEQCTRMESDYVWPYVGLADSYATLAANSLANPAEMLPRAESAALHAIELAPDMAEVHLSLGYIRYCQWEWKGAEAEYARARRLNPALFQAFFRSAVVAVAMGRFDDAVALLHEAQVLDPFSPLTPAALSETYYYQRNFERAAEMARSIAASDPVMSHFLLGKALWRLGRIGEARAEFKQWMGAPTSPSETRLRPLWLKVGDPAGGRTLLWTILNHPEPNDSPWVLAQMCAMFGETEEAWKLLDRAIQIRQPDVVCVQWDPVFDAMRGDARYPKLVARLGAG